MPGVTVRLISPVPLLQGRVSPTAVAARAAAGWVTVADNKPLVHPFASVTIKV